MGPTDPPPDATWLIEEWTATGWRRIREVVGEAAAVRAVGEAGRDRRSAPPLCAGCLQRDHVFWNDDNRDCPLCDRRGRSGSWVVCAACAQEAGVCVLDAVPVDGSSEEPVPWLAEVVAGARRDEGERAGRPRGTGRYSTSRDPR
jgi:hypothetical protein